MGSIAECGLQIKEYMKLKTAQQKLFNLNNKKNTKNNEQGLSGMWDYKKRSKIHVIKVPKGEKDQVRLKSIKINNS